MGLLRERHITIRPLLVHLVFGAVVSDTWEFRTTLCSVALPGSLYAVNDPRMNSAGITARVHECFYHLVLFLLLYIKRGTKTIKGGVFQTLLSSYQVLFLIKWNNNTPEITAPKISNPGVDFSGGLFISATVVSNAEALGSLILITHASLSPAP